jgi:hypothetical protein
MQEAKLSGRKKLGDQTVSLNVQVVFFQEEGIFYAYMPSLDLTGCGKTAAEARKSLIIVLDEFLRYTFNKSTFFEELKRLGWKIRSKSKPMTAPKMSEMIRTNEQLKDIINTKHFSTSELPVHVPVFA